MNLIIYPLIICTISSTFSDKGCVQTEKLSTDSSVKNEYKIDDIAIKIIGGKQNADYIARKYGFINLGEIPQFKNIYHFRRFTTKNRRNYILEAIYEDKLVKWIEPQVTLVRVKRDFLKTEDNGENLSINTKRMKGTNVNFNDELWTSQWYIWGRNKYSRITNLGITEAWKMGYTGKGIVISVLDDGLEHNHTDINKNYDPDASIDINGNDLDPLPQYNGENSHGTRCAGEIAMIANNHKCGVGVAYNARIGGIRLLDGRISDIVEALALSHKIGHIDIYSSSWGPHDDGETVDGPKSLAREAILKGIYRGRNGRGSIYVWANGNGGSKGDNCNCDGYAGSIYTISIGSATESGRFPWYGEECSSTMAVTYSSGDNDEQRVSTIDLMNQCTMDHTGTSASAPIAAGIFALLLEANNNITWRDVQHLVAWTSEFAPLYKSKGWMRNGAGLMFNSKFGFGLLNAESLIRKSLNWTNVPHQRVCHVLLRINSPIRIISDHESRLKFTTKGCQNTGSEINYLEHVQLKANIRHPVRGALEIILISPMNTSSVLLTRRVNDKSSEGFNHWYFTSVQFWGESSRGVWKIRIIDRSTSNFLGFLNQAQLILYGTREKPQHMNQRRSYHFENSFSNLLKMNNESNKEIHISEPMQPMKNIFNSSSFFDLILSSLDGLLKRLKKALK